MCVPQGMPPTTLMPVFLNSTATAATSSLSANVRRPAMDSFGIAVDNNQSLCQGWYAAPSAIPLCLSYGSACTLVLTQSVGTGPPRRQDLFVPLAPASACYVTHRGGGGSPP